MEDFVGFLCFMFFVVSVSAIVFFSVFKFTTAEEGKGKAFKFLGKYCCSIMSLDNFHFGPSGFIEPGVGANSTKKHWSIWKIGGWIFYIRWFVTPTWYSEQNNEDGFGGGDNVFLNQIQRGFTLEKAETKEDIPVNLKAAFVMKVVNIYFFLFTAPKDVIAKVIEIMESIARAWIKGNEYKKVQEVSSNGGKIWDHFEDDSKAAIKSTIKKIKEDWGVDILPESISIMDVGLLEKDQDVFAEMERQKRLTAAAAQEILGGMLEIKAYSMGVPSVKEAIVELKKTSKGQSELEAMETRAFQVVVQRALGIKPNLFGNVDGSSMDPITGAVASLIALAKSNVPQQGGQQGGKFDMDDDDGDLEKD